MATRKVKLTNQRKRVAVNDRNNYLGNGVFLVNWGLHWKSVWFGVLIIIALHFLIDFAMFGTPFPCKTTEVFADGSSTQICEVRK